MISQWLCLAHNQRNSRTGLSPAQTVHPRLSPPNVFFYTEAVPLNFILRHLLIRLRSLALLFLVDLHPHLFFSHYASDLATATPYVSFPTILVFHLEFWSRYRAWAQLQKDEYVIESCRMGGVLTVGLVMKEVYDITGGSIVRIHPSLLPR